MVRNPRRRRRLLDAAIDLMASVGARGLTFRGVDERAGVPTGTTSNYFASRDALLHAMCDHIFERLRPDPEHVARRLAEAPPSRDHETVMMLDILDRAAADRAGYLAFFELRMEAARSPHLAETFSARFRANLDAITADHVEGGFPGGPQTAVVLYLAMSGLLFEHLTLPGMLGGDDRLPEVVAALVERIVPDA